MATWIDGDGNVRQAGEARAPTPQSQDLVNFDAWLRETMPYNSEEAIPFLPGVLNFATKAGMGMKQGVGDYVDAGLSMLDAAPGVGKAAALAGSGLLGTMALLNRNTPVGPRVPHPGNSQLGMTGYHGSPHEFNQFDFDKIGTGEGAQVYGHGIYLAENRKVAKGYQDELTEDRARYIGPDGSGIDGGSLKGRLYRKAQSSGPEGRKYAGGAADEAWVALMNGENIDDRIKQAYNDSQNGDEMLANVAALEYVKGWSLQKPKGGLYEVDVPDEHVANMLDWDAPMSQQPEAVQKAYAAMQAKHADADAALLKELELEDFGPASGPMPEATGEQMYRSLADRYGDHAKSAVGASEYLRERGVPGLRYLDEGSRGAAAPGLGGTKWLVTMPGKPPQVYKFKPNIDLMPEGSTVVPDPGATRNMVLFDDQTATITHRNDELLMDEESRMRRAQDQGYDIDAYHGSTRDFKTFDASHHGTPEGHYGAHNYFTTSSDDLMNYSGEGPDLANRIERETERLADYDDDYGLREHLNVDDLDDVDQVTIDKALREMAMENLGIENRGTSYPVKLQGKNVLDSDKHVFEFEEAYDEATDEYGEATGEAVELLEHLRDAMHDWAVSDYQRDEVLGLVQENLYEGLSASDLEDMLRQNLTDLYDESTGDMVSAGAIISDVYERLGYDGVKMDAGKAFSHMGGTQGASHYVMFKPSAARSRFAKFDPANVGKADMSGYATPALMGATGAAGAAGAAGALALQPEQEPLPLMGSQPR